jgi:hypothetical protein
MGHTRLHILASVTASARILLGVAAAIVALESVVYIGVGGLDLADTSGGPIGVGLGAGILLVAYGLGQLFAAWHVCQGQRWARAPLVVTQLILILLGKDVRPEGQPWIAPTLIVSALVVLGCLLAPPVTRALSDNRSM